MSILVVDVGTSGVRAAVVRPDSTVEHVYYREVLPETPMQGFVQFDAAAMASAVLDVSRAALAGGGPVDAVGIANQRASTVVWDRATGEPVGPGVGWQDQRTVGMCLALREKGLRVWPNTSATKAAFLLDMADARRQRDLCVGTVDSWVAWTLSGGRAHITDPTNAGLTDLLRKDASAWDEHALEILNIPERALPDVVDSSGLTGATADALDGAPPIAGIAGDQQASLIGQGCTRPGMAKITFGTGGMLDVCAGATRPTFEVQGPHGSFPIIAWRLGGALTWGVEAAMLSAGSAVEWLRDDLGLVSSVAESHDVASQCADAGDVWFVPALLGLGAPMWDFGARGTFVGITRGSGRAELVRAVLEGVAHRGADLVESAENDSGATIPSLRIDGGMSANPTFVQAVADACQRPIEVSRVREATTLGAAFLAGLAIGTWSSLDDIAATWDPSVVVDPRRRSDRARWGEAVTRARAWLPQLSALDF